MGGTEMIGSFALHGSRYTNCELNNSTFGNSPRLLLSGYVYSPADLHVWFSQAEEVFT